MNKLPATGTRSWCGVLIAGLLVAWTAPPADARRIPSIREPSNGPYRAALLVEQETGRVLFESDSRRPWPPASLVKMMTALVAFDAIREGRLDPQEPVRVGPNASRTFGSRVYLRPGEVFPLEDLIAAMLVASANDAAVAVAEAVAGSVGAMVERMNARARELGMTDTVYRSVHGLPPPRGQAADVTSARDQALLARTLTATPEILAFSSRAETPFRRTRLRNTNRLIGRVDGVDGLKTGYYRVAGFNLTATASRDGMRLVSIVLGCPTLRCRFDEAERLLEWGFANYSKMSLIRAGEPLAVEVRVAGGTTGSLRPVAAQSSTWLLRDDEIRDVEVRFQVPTVVAAPVMKDQPLGEIIIHDGQGILDVVPAIAPQSVEKDATAAAPMVSN